jgi:hypothetical protein
MSAERSQLQQLQAQITLDRFNSRSPVQYFAVYKTVGHDRVGVAEFCKLQHTVLASQIDTSGKMYL